MASSYREMTERISEWFDADGRSIRSRTSRIRRQEWRRLFSEVLGTFFLVLVAAGGGMMGQAFPDTISRTAAVTAPALMVMAIILFMGKVSGAHLNPAVSVAFSLRGDFPVAAGARLHRRATRRRDPRRVVPAAGDQRVGGLRFELSGGRLHVVGRVLDGVHPHVGSGERDSRHRVRRAEHRHHRCVRGGRLHRARRVVGQPDLGCVDEPGPHVRSRPRRRRLQPLLGVRRRARSPARCSRSWLRSCCAAKAAAAPARAPPKATCTPKSHRPDKD